MSYGANAYAQMSQQTLSGAELEASVLIKAAARFQDIRDHWNEKKFELDEALDYNRKLWTILSTAATASDNPLPAEIKSNIGSLAVFIFNHQLKISTDGAPEQVNPLIVINREIAAGLRHKR